MKNIYFTRYDRGQYIYPRKPDNTDFTEVELQMLVEILNDLQLPMTDVVMSDNNNCEDTRP